MFKFDTYVNASDIWETAENHEDMGYIPGYVRGYNIEVKDNATDKTYWMSCVFTEKNPEEIFNDEFNQWYREINNVTPTGRICFRGYGSEFWDDSERDYCIQPVSDDVIRVLIKESSICI